MQESGRWCRKVVAGAGLGASSAGKWSHGAGVLVAAAGKMSPVQEGNCWCHLKGYYVRLSELGLKSAVRLRGWLLCLLHCAVSGGVWIDFLNSPEKGF